MAVALASTAHAAVTIYTDNFPGSSSNPLNGTIPATESGTLGGSSSVAWVARSPFTASGFMSDSLNDDGSAALPFTPQLGEVYTLSITLNTLSGGGWASFGFAQGDSIVNSMHDTNVGQPWMLLSATPGRGRCAIPARAGGQ